MTAKKCDDLTDVLHRAFALKKVVVMECPVDDSVNDQAFSKEI
jgi:acetolactate synthase-1/2/3 large subunit